MCSAVNLATNDLPVYRYSKEAALDLQLRCRVGTESRLHSRVDTESRLHCRVGTESRLHGRVGTESRLHGRVGTESRLQTISFGRYSLKTYITTSGANLPPPCHVPWCC